jgi:hypothetical protein
VTTTLAPITPGTPRALFFDVMRFRAPGRTLATLGGIWPSCFERWHREGLPAHLRTIPDLIAHFGLQPHLWCGPAAATFAHPPFPRVVLRETPTTVTYVNDTGITCTEFRQDGYQSMPHFEAFPVKCRADWASYRRRLAWNPARVGEAWTRQRAGWERREAPLILALGRAGSLYGSLRDLVGMEGLSCLFYDDPGLAAEMMDAIVALFLPLTSALFRDFVPDAVCLWEDMAYKNGPLLGERQVREFMLPRYRVMTAHLKRLGVPFILLDSDGDIRRLIPLWLEAGIDGVVPMEAQAGMDVAATREQYPGLLMMGAVDKKALAAGPAAIDRQMEKIASVVRRGGLVPFFDHGLPHDVAYADFVHFVKRLKEVTGLPGA